MKKITTLNILIILFHTLLSNGQLREREYVFQSERRIPVINNVDVLIIGGSTAAVSAAVSASEQGSKTFLISSKPYLGEDLCATLRLQIDKNRKLSGTIEKIIFAENNVAKPLEVKAKLNKALIDADVDFLFGSYITEVLWDENNQPSGVIIANRAGRQAIKAKVLIDATDHAWIGRMAGANSYGWEGDKITFERTIVMKGVSDDNPEYIPKKITIPMENLLFRSFAKAEQEARRLSYTEGQLRASESLFFIPPDPIVCKKTAEYWKDDVQLINDHFKVKDFDNIFILSGCADVPRSVADSLLKPAALTSIAENIGLEAANIAAQKKETFKSLFKYTSKIQNPDGNISEKLNGLRPNGQIENYVESPQMDIPVNTDFDVIVVGGGTTGAPAAIAAGWWGMKVLVVEYLEGLGGIGTLGLIGKPWHGNKIGFAAEVPFPEGNAEPKMEWYRSQIEKVGGEIWLGVLGCGAYIDNNIVKGVVICTPEGRSVVKAKVIIDATGSAEVAIAAGAEYMYGEIENNDIALQGTGFSSRPLQGNYYNSDYLLVDESDMLDIWRSLVSVQLTKASENVYDAVPIIQNRERKRIVGDYILTYIDQVTGRTFPDVIVISSSTYDSHGYPSSNYFALLPHDSISRKLNQPAPGGTCFTPYRSLLPKGLDGILVTGLGISMERDASAMVRMQLDLANQGYAAGVAAMLAITNNTHPREINVKELQKILVRRGNLPDSVLTLEDSFPLNKETVLNAVKSYGEATNPQNAGKPLAIILSHIDIALPIIKEEYLHSTGNKKLLFAQVLGMCGEKIANATLLEELEKYSEWDEKIFQGSMADFAHLPTPLDAIILSLGFSKDKTVLPVLLDLVECLDSSVTLSHHRSVALAIENIINTDAAKPLADLLQKPGMSGHTMLSLQDALTELDNDGKGPKPIKNSSYPKRTRALREIILARVLYKCGDYNEIGENILKNYQNDFRGLFVRHANKILNNDKEKSKALSEW